MKTRVLSITKTEIGLKNRTKNGKYKYTGYLITLITRALDLYLILCAQLVLFFIEIFQTYREHM